MPMIDADGCPLNVQIEGRDGAPALMLGNSLGTDLHMWDDQAAEFAKHFRLIRADRRGHGKSGASPGPYSFDRFGRDIVTILDALKIKKTNWCGLSMGGMDGQWLGAYAADRVEKLVLANTNFYYADKGPWADRIKFVRENGLEKLVGAEHGALVHQGLPRALAAGDRAHDQDVPRSSSKDGYIACVEAIRDMDFRNSNPRVTAPTLVIVGKQDPATPPAAGEEIARQIKGARLVALDAAHISNIEQPKAFTEAVLDFLR